MAHGSTQSRRRFLRYSASLALSGGLLAACAGTGGGGGSNSDLPALTHWYHQYGEKGTHEAVQRYAKQYTKAKVTVNWVPGTGNEYPDKVRTSLLGSNPPDVFELPNPTVDQVKAGLVVPLDDIISPVLNDFNENALKPLRINGKIYAIKMLNDMSMVYYRKSLFQKAGIEKEPQTIDELISAAKKLSNKDMKGLYIGSDGGIDALLYILGWAAGSEFLTEDNKITFVNERVAGAYEKLRELNASGGLLPDAPVFWWSSEPFKQGMCAMQWCGLWAMPEIQAALGDDFGVFPFPALDVQSKPAVGFGGWAEMISAKSKHIDAAKEYVKWLWIDNTDIQIDWNVGYGFHVPPRKSIAAKTDKLTKGLAAKAVEFLNAYGHSNTPYWDNAMQLALTDAVSNIVKHNADAMSELKKAADKCDKELQKLLS
uniref:Sugar ABC transporter substrate-binding protein n=1 Tax=Thermosporothrix sp. COM3 TaxID=2490863 RepID=A0A455SEN3_9CHLR|nr:sugar ABC transporter substrate-binding protein [Thermosporothrix sp. COM3]